MPESRGPGSGSEISVQTNPRHRPDVLNSYVTLSGIGASICEFRNLDMLSSDLNNKLGTDLIRWYTATVPLPQGEGSGTLSDQSNSLKLLWHYTFISLTVDLNILELAAGREGRHGISPRVDKYVESWTSSLTSKRTLFHALYLQNLIVMTNLGSSTAIHTARVLFSAALCWYCYILYLPSMTTAAHANPDEILEYLTQLPELRLLRMEGGSSSPTSHLWHKTMSSFQKILMATPAEIKENTLCILESALRGLGTSGISRRFADLIYIFISGEMNK